MEIRPLADGLFALSHTGFSPALNRAARSIPGMRQQGRDWVGYPDAVEATTSLLLAQKLRFDAGKGPEVLARAKLLGEPLVPLAEKGLRSYQLEGVKFLINRGRSGALLADSPGLGKTAQAIIAARGLNSPTVIVCPSFARGVWRRELGKWWPKLHVDKVFFPEGVKKIAPLINRALTSIIVIHYDILYAWLEKILDWGPRIVIFDEGHILSSEKSRRSAACRELARASQHRWVLTGTPMLNRPKDLWGLMQTLSPNRFGAEDKFFPYALRYCAAHKVEIEAIQKTVWDFSGISHESELRARLSWLMLRRQLSDPEVALDLPPKTRNVVWLEGSKKQKAFSLTNKRELRAALDSAADAKLPTVIETLINDGWETPRVVFCWRKSVVSAVAESYRAAGAPSVETITGDVLPKERERRIARCRSGILVVTIDSCGVAIDLSHAPYADFVEFVHEPWKFIQAEARVHRFGQQSKTVVRYFAQSGSADELIIDNVVNKLEAIGAIVGSSDEEKSLQKKLSGEGFSEEDILKDIFAGVEI